MATARDDGRDPDVVTYRAFSGLRNDIGVERFGLSDLAEAVNVDLDKSGRLARRRGFASVAVGNFHSLWASRDETKALLMAADQLQVLNADYTRTTVAAGLTVSAPMSYTEVNDRVYFSNGMQTGVFENGRVRSWGIAAPGLPGVSITVGNMPAGVYQYVMTYFRDDGQESGADVAATVTVPAGGGLIFSMPVSSNPGVSAKAVYLTAPDSDILFQALVVPNATTTVAYQGDTTEFSLPLMTQFMRAPLPGQLTAYYRGHMFVAVDNVLYSSTPFGYELFDLRKFIQTDGRITLLAPIEDKEVFGAEGRNSGFFIGTDRSCGVLVGSDPDNFQYVPKTNYGAVEGALAYVDGTVYADASLGARQLPMWQTTQGICLGLPGMEIRNITRNRYNFSAGGRGAAFFEPGPNRFVAVSQY